MSNNERLKKNMNRFYNELKISVNQKLFDKNVISEEIYWKAKEI